MEHHHLYLLVCVIALGMGAQWLASHFRFPVILLLLAVGILVGPTLAAIFGPERWFVLKPDELLGDLFHPFISLAIALVLFEGGLTLDLREARDVGRTLGRLILSGLVLGFALTTLCAHYVAGLSWSSSSVLGAILVVTGPTVILPLLRGARIASRPATLLKWEGIVNDPLGVLLALFVVAIIGVADEEGRQYAIADHVIRFAGTSVLASLLGAGLGFALHRALDRGIIAEHIKSPVIFASVMSVYTLSFAFGDESGGLLAVTVLGLVLTNVDNAHIEDVRRFKEQFSVLLLSVLFILLSAQLQLDDLEKLLGMPMVLIGLIVFFVRPVVGFAATLGSDLPRGERCLLAWIAPRGVVAAAMAGALAPELQAAGVEDARLLVPIVFGVIISTVLLHGLSLGPMARRMGLAHEEGRGILIVGASLWAVSLCQVLANAGAKVVLADTRYRRVSRARQEGLEVHFGDVLAEEAAMELPMEQTSWVFAATDDDAYNSLVCLRFGPELGREQVLQVTPTESEASSKETLKSHMMGRNPWADEATNRAISSRFWQGGSFKTTNLSEAYPFVELKAQNPNGLFLFCVKQGRLQVLGTDQEPPQDAKVIWLTDAAPQPDA